MYQKPADTSGVEEVILLPFGNITCTEKKADEITGADAAGCLRSVPAVNDLQVNLNIQDSGKDLLSGNAKTKSYGNNWETSTYKGNSAFNYGSSNANSLLASFSLKPSNTIITTNIILNNYIIDDEGNLYLKLENMRTDIKNSDTTNVNNVDSSTKFYKTNNTSNLTLDDSNVALDILGIASKEDRKLFHKQLALLFKNLDNVVDCKFERLGDERNPLTHVLQLLHPTNLDVKMYYVDGTRYDANATMSFIIKDTIRTLSTCNVSFIWEDIAKNNTTTKDGTSWAIQAIMVVIMD